MVNADMNRLSRTICAEGKLTWISGDGTDAHERAVTGPAGTDVKRVSSRLEAISLTESAPFEPPSIFEQSWWLDAAAPDRWSTAEVHWGDRRVGRMIFCTGGHKGLRYIQPPPYTRTLAPRFDLPTAKPARIQENRVRVLSALLEQLPPHHRFEMTLPPYTDALYAFVRLGYLVATSYTFRSRIGATGKGCFADMEAKSRNIIRAGLSRFKVEHHDDLHRLTGMMRAERRHMKDLNNYRTLERLWLAIRAHESGTIITAVDEKGRDAASAALIWDAETLYFWVSARDRERSGNSSNALLIWKAIELALSTGRIFDIDGFASQESARYISRLGLEAVARPVVNHGGPVWKALFLARNLLRREPPGPTYRA